MTDEDGLVAGAVERLLGCVNAHLQTRHETIQIVMPDYAPQAQVRVAENDNLHPPAQEVIGHAPISPLSGGEAGNDVHTPRRRPVAGYGGAAVTRGHGVLPRAQPDDRFRPSHV